MNLQQMHHLNASELLITAVRALEDNPALLEKMRNRYDFLAVDNAQHLDPLSQKLVEMIGEHTPIFVVGGNTNGLVYSEPDRPAWITGSTTIGSQPHSTEGGEYDALRVGSATMSPDESVIRKPPAEISLGE